MVNDKKSLLSALEATARNLLALGVTKDFLVDYIGGIHEKWEADSKMDDLAKALSSLGYENISRETLATIIKQNSTVAPSTEEKTKKIDKTSSLEKSLEISDDGTKASYTGKNYRAKVYSSTGDAEKLINSWLNKTLN